MPDVGPKKNLAETGHPKMAKILGPLAKKITLFDTKKNKKKGQQVLLASHFFVGAFFLSVLNDIWFRFLYFADFTSKIIKKRANIFCWLTKIFFS